MPVFEAQYAPYIWAVYALALVVIGALILATALSSRAAKRDLKRITKAQNDKQKEADQ